jgi:hypothetical protein
MAAPDAEEDTMNLREALENEETRNLSEPSLEVTAVLVEFRTGTKVTAGTDASVFLRIGQQTFPIPEEYGKNPFERGATDRYGFVLEPPLTLDGLRRAEIEVYHDSEGTNPGWFLDSIRLFLRLTGHGEQPFLYKEWREVGWLAIDEPPNSTQVMLQRGT